MNIYDRLEQDHDRQKELAAAISETSGDSAERRDLWEQFMTEAEAHANAEEQVFYAALMENPELQEQARHSVSEHEEASNLIEELSELDMSSGGWLMKFTKLREDLEHHIEEEETEVFVQARGAIDDERATRMASEFDERKDAEVESLVTG